MKRIHFTLIALATLFTLVSCSREDDIDEIFPGHTWYMTGGRFNGLELNADVKNFYTEANEGAYYITFSSNTFKGELSDGVNFAGSWSANGKHQTIRLNITQVPNSEETSVFDKRMLQILSGTGSYESGTDFLRLIKDKGNLIIFGNTRSKVKN